MLHHSAPTPGGVPTKLFIPRFQLVHVEANSETEGHPLRLDQVFQDQCFLMSLVIFPFEEGKGLQGEGDSWRNTQRPFIGSTESVCLSTRLWWEEGSPIHRR